jgi:hypothetical protein
LRKETLQGRRAQRHRTGEHSPWIKDALVFPACPLVFYYDIIGSVEMLLTRFLNVGGAISCGLGGILALISISKGKLARQLQGAHQVENLTGTEVIKSF